MTSHEFDKRIIQRIAAADFVLSELEKGRFPHLSKFLNNARFNLRQITDASAFQEGQASADARPLYEASHAGGTIHVAMEPAPRVSLFYDKDLTATEASLFARSLRQVAALAFAALGLDMSGLGAMQEITLKRGPTNEGP